MIAKKSRRPFSVLMVIERFFPLVGGAETQCFQLSSALVKKGIKVVVVTKKWIRETPKEEISQNNFRIVRLGLPGGGRLRDYWAGFSLAFFILRSARSFNLFYINGGLANIFGSTAILLGKIFGKKVIAKVETPGELFFSGPEALVNKSFVHPLIKIRLFFAKKADIFIAQTPKIKRQLLKFGVREERIEMITNSVDTEFFRPPSLKEKSHLRKKWGLPLNRVIVMFCGRLVKRKGLKYVLDAWGKGLSSKACLVIVGSGENQPDSVEFVLKRQVKDRRLENVIFLGSKNREEVAELLKTADIFIYPSIHPEGTALSVLEAMATGLAVVVSNIGGLNDVVTDREDGLLFPPNNSNAIEKTLLGLINNQEERERLGKKARKKVKEEYSVDRVVKDYIRLFGIAKQ